MMIGLHQHALAEPQPTASSRSPQGPNDRTVALSLISAPSPTVSNTRPVPRPAPKQRTPHPLPPCVGTIVDFPISPRRRNLSEMAKGDGFFRRVVGGGVGGVGAGFSYVIGRSGSLLKIAQVEGVDFLRTVRKALVENKDAIQVIGGSSMLVGGIKFFCSDNEWKESYVDARIAEAMGPVASNFALSRIQNQSAQVQDLKMTLLHHQRAQAEELRRIKDKLDSIQSGQRTIQRDQAVLWAILKEEGYDLGAGPIELASNSK